MEFIKILLIFACACFGAVCFNFRTGKEGNRQASFERFNNTCAGRHVPIIFSYTGLQIEKGKLWINCSYKVNEDILEDPKFSLNLERCTNMENLDTCEHFYTYKTEKFCTMIDHHNVVLTSFNSAFKPKLHCPLKKGVYRATNAMLDMQALLPFPVDAWFWRATALATDKITNKILMCLFAEARVTIQ